MFEAATIIVIISAALGLYRAMKGPTVFDRIMAVNLLGTKTIVLIALIGYMSGRPHFMDLALAYALINFIATIAFLKYKESGGLD